MKLVRDDLAKNGVRNLEAVELGLREAVMKDSRSRSVLTSGIRSKPRSLPHSPDDS
ncbi:MAG: hypothetical protein ACREFX_15105 [Opitutaceae bacterium]